jgi:hypothetical protein
MYSAKNIHKLLDLKNFLDPKTIDFHPTSTVATIIGRRACIVTGKRVAW